METWGFFVVERAQALAVPVQFYRLANQMHQRNRALKFINMFLGNFLSNSPQDLSSMGGLRILATGLGNLFGFETNMGRRLQSGQADGPFHALLDSSIDLWTECA